MIQASLCISFFLFTLVSTQLVLTPLTNVKVLTFVPTPTSAPSLPAKLYGSDSITVFFSGPVIALGASWGPEIPTQYVPFTITGYPGTPVPGKIRWVTTSIARFDPDIEWPPYLRLTVTVSVNQTFAGVPIFPAQTTYETGVASMSIDSVSSAFTDASTNSHWQSSWPSVGEDFVTTLSGYEVPPDGVIRLSFSTDVDISNVAAALTITPTITSFSVTSCPGNVTTCAQLVPKGHEQDTEYTITLPRGIQLNQYAGPATSDFTATFWGIYGFRFTPNSNKPGRAFRLYVRHGLKNTTLPSDLSHAFAISQHGSSIPINVTAPAPYYVQIESYQLLPNATCVLTVVSNSLLDAWGLPLEGSTINFQTAPSVSALLSAYPNADGVRAIFEEGQSLTSLSQWNIYSRYPDTSCGGKQGTIEFTNINDQTIAQAIASVSNSLSSFVSGSNTTKVVLSNDGVQNSPTPFGTSGLFLMESWTSCVGKTVQKSAALISQSNLGVTFIYSANRVTVWVTKTDTGASVPGATVDLYFVSPSYPVTPSSVSLGSKGSTDANGLAAITSETSGSAVIVVSYGGQIYIGSQFYLNRVTTSSQLQATLVTDRAFYAAGDSLYWKAFIRYTMPNGTVQLPGLETWTLSIQWRSSDPSPTEYSGYAADPSYGTIFDTITIPSDVAPGSYFITVRGNGKTPVSNPVFSQSFIISQPRIPTVQMTFTSEKQFYQLGQTFPINISLATYTGVNIPNAQVTLLWTVTSATPIFVPLGFYFGLGPLRPLPPTTTESGQLTLTTDAQGSIIYSLDLSLLVTNKTIAEGAQITLTATYFSATKEQVTQKITRTTAFSQYALTVRTSFDDLAGIWPNVKFGVFATIQDITTNLPLVGQQVKVALYANAGPLPPVAADGTVQFVGAPHQTCTFTTTAVPSIGCIDVLSLPSVGNFILVASSTVSSTVIQTVLSLGKNQTEWENAPLQSLGTLYAVTDKVSYAANSDVKIVFHNPFGSSASLLLHWGSGYTSFKTRVVSPIPTNSDGSSQVTVQLGDECPERSGCVIDLILAVPRGLNRLSLPVPTSVLFDPDAPASITKQFYFDVVKPPNTLNVNVAVESPILEPGATSDVIITVTKGGVPVMAEVAVYAVNKAVLDLVPNPVPQYDQTLASQINGGIGTTIDFSQRLIATTRAYAAAWSILLSRVLGNPWVSLASGAWPLQPTGYSNDVDESDSTFFEAFITWLADSPYSILRFPMADKFESLPAAGAASDSFQSNAPSATPQPVSDTAVSVRSNFVTTPLFVGRVVTAPDGTAHVSFKTPDNLGTFEIRAYAIDSNDGFGTGTANQIVRRTLSMQYSGPSIVRVGDKFKAGVAITVTDPLFDADVFVQVGRVCELLDLLGPLDQIDPPTRKVHLTGVGPHLINFSFRALGVGTIPLGWMVRMANSGQLVDVALFNQVSAGQQEQVYIATSMAITDGAPTTEGFAPPAAVPFSGTVNIVVGLGRLPAIQNFYAMVAARANASDTTWISSEDWLATILAHMSLMEYSQNTAEPLFVSSFTKLALYTNSIYGLQAYNGIFSFYYTNVDLQAFGLFVSSLLSKTSIATSSQLSSLQTLAATWRGAMDKELVRQAQQARQFNTTYSDFDTLAFVFLGTDFSWTPSMADPQSAADLSLSRLLLNTDNLSTEGKAALVLAALRDSTFPQRPDVNALLTELTNTLRVQGRSEYLSTGDGEKNPSFLGSAIGLIDLVVTGNTILPIDKLANFIAQEDSSSRIWFSSMQAAYFMHSLAIYDKSRGNTNPNLEVTVTNGTSGDLIDAFFKSPTDPAVSKSFLYESISVINFAAQGSGEASIVFGASFVPANVSSAAIYNGMDVSKIVQRVDPVTFDAVGPAITTANIGETVRVTIQVNIPDYSSTLFVVDPFPGSIEPLDDLIYQTDNSFNPAIWWQPPTTKRFYKDKVMFIGSSMFAGVHTFTYLALVNSEGEFVMGPALAYDGRQPELNGLSAGGTFNTKSISGTPIESGNLCFIWSSRTFDPNTLPSQFSEQIISITPSGSYVIASSLVLLFVVVCASLL